MQARRSWQYAAWSACTFVLLFLDPGLLRAEEVTFQEVIAPFLKQHCHSCHGSEKPKGQLRLDRITGVKAANRNLWTMIHERLAAGEMPPSHRKQPADAERKKVLTWVREQQRALRGGTRRLNRRELSAALQDVTGLAVDFSTALPGDGKVAGFDTGADGLHETSDAVAVWLAVTRRAVDGIRFLEPAKKTVFAADLRDMKDIRRDLDRAWKEHGARVRPPRQPRGGRLGLGMFIEGRAVGERDSCRITIPVSPKREGVLRLTLTVAAMKPFAGIPNPHLWVKIGGRYVDHREITASVKAPQKLVYEAHIGDLVVQPAGIEIQISNKVEVPYAVKGFANDNRGRGDDRPVSSSTSLFRPKYDRRTLPPEKQPTPYIIVHSIKIEPDVSVAWPPAEWKADIGQIKNDLDSAGRLLDLWMQRAWRRPVAKIEQVRFLNLYRKLRDKGMSFDNALRAVFQSVLLSAPFRYHASPGQNDAALAQYALASRLSFMLIGGPPDAELRRLAAAGKLSGPDPLNAQVDRLLTDPRSQRFFRPFLMQWLQMEQPITIVQDDIQDQHFRFARYLKASMREETIAYITQLFAENRPAKELLSSDWTMMNDILALHYGYKGVEGGHQRKVKLRADDLRGGGILGHAGLQSMLCWMGDNWVIYRGAWTLRNILDDPPPPPPLDVPELDSSAGKNRGKTFRELLKLHQQDNRCAVCHRKIDPVGFAFQNFDISGRWREVEHEHYKRDELDGRIAWKGVGKTRRVDSVGRLPRGETFKTLAEFKTILVKNYQEDIVRGLLKKLILYSTGRVPGIDDLAEIRTMMKEQRGKGYRLRDLLKALVRSRAFRETI